MRHAVPVLALLAASAFSCSSAEPPPEVHLGELVEVLGDPMPASVLLGPAGAAFVVGGAGETDALLAFRAAWRPAGSLAPLHAVLDVSQLSALDRTSLGDRLIEPALDGAGPIFLDLSGATAGALRDGRPGLHYVELDAERRVRAAREVRAE